LAVLVLAWLMVRPAWGQFKKRIEDPKGPQVAQSQVQRWQFGMTVTAQGGPCKGAVGYVPVPLDWPEQQVAPAQEEFSPSVKVRFQMVEGTVRLMVIEIPYLPAGEQAKALLTFEVCKYSLVPPKDTGIFEIPGSKRVPRDIKPYLARSPLIESTNPKIKAAWREVSGGKEGAWEKVEAAYDWVREKFEVRRGPAKGAMAALRDGHGDAEDLVSLFIALCRAGDVPARTVWVPGHCYAEFYLVDDEGKGHWFPCELTGNRSFGGISDPRPVIEKGDNFRDPANPRERQRFLAEYLKAPAVAQPKVRWVRQPSAQ
jgi:hypothetical protein